MSLYTKKEGLHFDKHEHFRYNKKKFGKESLANAIALKRGLSP